MDVLNSGPPVQHEQQSGVVYSNIMLTGPVDGGFVNACPDATQPLRIDPEVLYGFGVVDPNDQTRIAKLLEMGLDIGDESFHKSIKTMMKSMTTYTISSRRIFDANKILESEKNDLLSTLSQRDAQIADMARSKDEEYRARLDHLENELRQRGLETENLVSSHQEALDRLTSDAHSAREEMDRVQRAYDSKDSEVEDLRKELREARAAAAACGAKETEISSLRARVDGLEGELRTSKDGHASMESQLSVLREAQDLSRDLVDGVNNLVTFGVFHDKCSNSDVVCPILCCSGVIASMKSVVTAWAETGGRLDGSVERTFQCVETGGETTIVPRAQLEVVQTIASAIGVSVERPCEFEYCVDGAWVKFSVFDLLAVVSRVCLIYRSGSADGEVGTLMMKGGLVIMFSLGDTAGRKRLSCSVHRMMPGVAPATYEGRFRVTADDWNPFENLDF